jgi:DNA-binding GntR family transcriptional regulator
MQDQTKQISSARDRLLERAIVSQTLRKDHIDGWRRTELAAELGDADPIAIRNALTRLEEDGVVEFAGETVSASRAARRLNDLDMIAV